MRYKQLVILLLSSFQLFAFKSPDIHAAIYKQVYIDDYYTEKSDRSNIEFLQSYFNLRENEKLVQRNSVILSHAQHYQYNHSLHDKTILGSGVNLHIYANGKAMIQYYLIDIESFVLMNEEQLDFLIPYEGYLIAASKQLNTALDEEQWEFRDKEGRLLHTENKYRYYKDTTVKAKVFMVNPVNSAQTTYGGMYVDNGDQTNDSLDKQLFEVEMYARYDNDSFYLEHDILYFGEVSGPYLFDRPILANDSFFYNRSQKRFEAVNAYYHILQYYAYLQDIGYDTLVKPTKLDVHAIGGDDNSRFDPDLYTLEFGDGNVDDAEDAEVVLHEFTHGLSTTASYTFGNSRQRNAMEEGNCDYICKSYSRSINDYNSYNVFSWDGHNEFWSGVDIGSTDHYPEDLKNNRNDDRDIWSSSLMCIHDYIGRDATDSLVLEHLSYQFASSTMPDMAQILLHIDTVLFNQRYYSAIKECMVNRGFMEYSAAVTPALEKDVLLLRNSLAFAQGSGPLIIETEDSYTIRLFNSIGQELMHRDAKGTFYLEASDYSPGMYILQIEIKNKQYSFKILR